MAGYPIVAQSRGTGRSSFSTFFCCENVGRFDRRIHVRLRTDCVTSSWRTRNVARAIFGLRLLFARNVVAKFHVYPTRHARIAGNGHKKTRVLRA